MCGSDRTGVRTPSSSSSCTSLGITSGRSRARRSTDDGSRSGTTADASTMLFGTMIESSPRANVVYSSPSVDTTPSISPARPPDCSRTRSPTLNGRAEISTTPAIRLPSVCCDARPKITATIAPETASVRGSMPAMRSATSIAATRNPSRMRKPTVPAVAGSIRLNSCGASVRPTSRASRQPRISSAIAVNTRTGVSRPKISSRYSLASSSAAISWITIASSIRARAARCAAWTVSARARAAGCAIGALDRNRGIVSPLSSTWEHERQTRLLRAWFVSEEPFLAHLLAASRRRLAPARAAAVLEALRVVPLAEARQSRGALDRAPFSLRNVCAARVEALVARDEVRAVRAQPLEEDLAHRPAQEQRLAADRDGARLGRQLDDPLDLLRRVVDAWHERGDQNAGRDPGAVELPHRLQSCARMGRVWLARPPR